MSEILVVDDDADFRRAMVEILTDAGYRPCEAASGREALDKCDKQRFDLILLDLVLPGMDGLEVLRVLRKRDDRVKIILVTAFATVESAVDGIKLGANDYVAKPFSVSEFVTLVQRTLVEMRFERELQEEFELHNLFGSLASPTRRAIVERLESSPGGLRLTELMHQLVITDHAKLAFHLRNLLEHGVITKSGERVYQLTAQGRELLAGLRQLSLRMRLSALR